MRWALKWGVTIFLLLWGVSPSWAADNVCTPELTADRVSLEFFVRPRTTTIKANVSLAEPLKKIIPFYLGRPIINIENSARLAYADALDQGKVISYKLKPLTQKVNGVVYALEADRFILESRYYKKTKEASHYRTLVGIDLIPLLGGVESKRDIEVETTLSFEADWSDLPGTYKGRLVPDNRDRSCPLPEFDIELTIAPNVAVDLKSEEIEITPSSRTSPILNEVEVWLSSNQSRWDLYVTAEKLEIERGKDIILPKSFFVREKGVDNWHSLAETYKVSSGAAGASKRVATLEFFIESQQETPPGDYEGKLHWMVDTK
jgi:hypothetical protein